MTFKSITSLSAKHLVQYLFTVKNIKGKDVKETLPQIGRAFERNR